MDISSIAGINTDLAGSLTSTKVNSDATSDSSFSSIFNSLLSSVSETNDLQNSAESAEIQFALGDSDNTHDLLIAESKAEVALQYTVAIRDKLIDGYKELMQMSI